MGAIKFLLSIIKVLLWGIWSAIEGIFGVMMAGFALLVLIGYPILFFLFIPLMIHYAEYKDPTVFWWFSINIVQLLIEGVKRRERATN